MGMKVSLARIARWMGFAVPTVGERAAKVRSRVEAEQDMRAEAGRRRAEEVRVSRKPHDPMSARNALKGLCLKTLRRRRSGGVGVGGGRLRPLVKMMRAVGHDGREVMIPRREYKRHRAMWKAADRRERRNCNLVNGKSGGEG